MHCMDVAKGISVLDSDYDLVLMDPPYKLTQLDPVLDSLASSKLLSEGATVVVGHSKRLTLNPEYQSLCQVGHYRYGDSTVDFFEMRRP